VEGARVVAPGRLVVAAVDGRQATAVAVEQEPGERVAARRPGLEVHEVTGPVGGRPPADERRARPEREVAPLAGLEQQVVEAVERDRRRLRGLGEALPQPAPAETRVVADDDDAARLGLANPLAGGLRDAVERALLVGAGEGQRHPVAGRLDLLDRVEARLREGVGELRRGGHLAVGGDDVDALGLEQRRDLDEAGRVVARRAGRDRAARDVGAEPADLGPRPEQREHARTGRLDDVARQPAAGRPVSGPLERLVDVAVRQVDRVLVPGRWRLALDADRPLERPRIPVPRDPGHAASPPASPANAEAEPAPLSPRRRRSIRTRGGLGRAVDLAPERVEDQVPRPDVLHLASTEAGLEVGDPAGREAPQVVARRALLARRPDRLPLQEVVRPRVAAGRRHPAVRLDDARPAADEEQRRDGLAVLRLGEQQPGQAVRGERLPDVAVGLLGPDQEAGPGRRLLVDPVELRQPVASGVDDRHAGAPGLVHVLPPLLAEIAPEGVLVGGEIDDPGRVGLDRRGGPEPGVAQRPSDRAVLVGRTAGLELGVDPDVGHATGPLPEGRPAGFGEGRRGVPGAAGDQRPRRGRGGRRRTPRAADAAGGRGPGPRPGHPPRRRRAAAPPTSR
jgi:hypothetical protein